jgi:hypothetical protein
MVVVLGQPFHGSLRRGAPSNDLTSLEEAMLNSLRPRGQVHLGSSFMKRRKYSRVWRSTRISQNQGVSLWLRR